MIIKIIMKKAEKFAVLKKLKSVKERSQKYTNLFSMEQNALKKVSSC